MNNHFRKRPSGPTLSREEADRQGRISNLALSTLGSAEAIAFLNGANEALGARPLDLAIKSEDGFTAVEQLIASLASAS